MSHISNKILNNSEKIKIHLISVNENGNDPNSIGVALSPFDRAENWVGLDLSDPLQ